MRGLRINERRKRGCEYCSCMRLKKLCKARADGDTDIDEYFKGRRGSVLVYLCPHAKCKFSELDEIEDYIKDYDRKMEVDDGKITE